MTTDLKDAASAVRVHAHAPYSNFKVGAAIRSASGRIFVGCNVENVAYPEGTCAEAGAIAAMVAAGETEIAEAYVIAGSSMPVSPCGGCRQKLAEFAEGGVVAVRIGDQVLVARRVVGHAGCIPPLARPGGDVAPAEQRADSNQGH